MRDVSLGVELLWLVDADLDLSGADAVDNSVHTGEEGVTGLALHVDGSVQRGRDGICRGSARLSADEKADLVHLLPGAVEG